LSFAIAGLEKENRFINEKERKIAAYHEAVSAPSLDTLIQKSR